MDLQVPLNQLIHPGFAIFNISVRRNSLLFCYLTSKVKVKVGSSQHLNKGEIKLIGRVLSYLSNETVDSIVMLLETLKVSMVTRTRNGR